MTGWRTFLRRHFALALLMLCLGLAMRGIIPAGYMVDGNPSGPLIKVCGEVNGAPVALDVWRGGKGPDKAPHHGPEGACPYSVLSYGSLAGPIALAELPAGILSKFGNRPLPSSAIVGAWNNNQPPARAPPAA